MSRGGTAAMCSIAVGEVAAVGAARYVLSISMAMTTSPTRGSWAPYIAWAERSMRNSDTPQVSGRRARARTRAFRNLYLRRVGCAGRIG